jgi:hypothetical protein
MHRRRGAECGAKRAEAYILAGPRKDKPTLPTPFLGRSKPAA